jgi:hypothetical protein
MGWFCSKSKHCHWLLLQQFCAEIWTKSNVTQTWSSPKWLQLHFEIGPIRLKFNTTKHVHPKKFSSDLRLFRQIWGWICVNAFSSTMQDLHNQSKLCTVLLLNRVQFWSFLTSLLFGRYRVRTNLRVFLGNLRFLYEVKDFLTFEMSAINGSGQREKVSGTGLLLNLSRAGC